MELINNLAQAYAEKFTSPEDEVLKGIASEVYQHHPDPQMMSGHLQGRVLEFISRIIRPQKILEVGTMSGYSAICLARGLSKQGKLHTIELKEADAGAAKENFKKAGLENDIILHTGNALEIIPTLHENWDLVFIDADKAGYIDYYDLVMPDLKPGGIILADNVLFHGDVLEEPIKGKNGLAIDAFNRHVKMDNRSEQVMLTIRDGLMLIRKK